MGKGNVLTGICLSTGGLPSGVSALWGGLPSEGVCIKTDPHKADPLQLRQTPPQQVRILHDTVSRPSVLEYIVTYSYDRDCYLTWAQRLFSTQDTKHGLVLVAHPVSRREGQEIWNMYHPFKGGVCVSPPQIGSQLLEFFTYAQKCPLWHFRLYYVKTKKSSNKMLPLVGIEPRP